MSPINIVIDQKPINYTIEIGENILNNIFNLIDDKKMGAYILIHDKQIDPSKINSLFQSFPDSKKPHLISIDLSERGKTFDGFNYIKNKLIEYNCDKSTTLIAMGGGSIGDLVGFVASTFYRGIDYIQIPSTLLSMIDSSIGGKTAVDMEDGKNLIGSYYHPKIVIIDPTILHSINKTEINSALFEAIKYGLAINFHFFQYLSSNIDDLKNMINLTSLIKKCCEIKVAIIQKDEKDNNERQKLNFGHTIGHAIETIYDIKHGEAVGYGMISACYMSKLIGTFKNSSYNQSVALIKKLTLPRIKPNWGLILNQVKRDKKRAKGKNNFILLNEIGSSYISNDISDDMINNSIPIL